MTGTPCCKPQGARAVGKIALVSLLVVLAPLVVRAGGRSSPQVEAQKSQKTPVYLRIELADGLKVSHLKPGNVVEGRLTNDVYRGETALFPAGSRVRLTVDKMLRRRKEPNDHWPWVVRLFLPRHENYPTFRSAIVILPDGSEVPLPVSFLSLRKERNIHVHVGEKAESEVEPSSTASLAESPKDQSFPSPRAKSRGKKKPRQILTLEARVPPSGQAEALSTDEFAAPNPPAGPVTLAAGTQVQVILLQTLSASKSRPGDLFLARVIQPVRLASDIVLPEGTLVEGRVLSRKPPRMLSRAGNLEIDFSRLILPGGGKVPVEASVAAAELDRRSHTKIDREGKLTGDHPGKAWMLINLGVSGGMAKVSDDASQLILEAILSTATDASTAGTARIVGACVSGIFLLTRHGRDVVLPKYTEMTISFDRQVLLTSSEQSSMAAAAAADDSN